MGASLKSRCTDISVAVEDAAQQHVIGEHVVKLADTAMGNAAASPRAEDATRTPLLVTAAKIPDPTNAPVPPFELPPVAGQRHVTIATDVQLAALLARNNGYLVPGAALTVGVEFALVRGCRKHNRVDGGDCREACVAAVAIASAGLRSPGSPETNLVLLLDGIKDTAILAKAFRLLWSDERIIKVVYAVGGPATVWYPQFGRHLLDDGSSGSLRAKTTVDLQLLLTDVLDSRRRDASAAHIASTGSANAAANQWALLNRSVHSETAFARSSLQRICGEQASCLPDAVTVQTQQQIVQNAQRLASIFMSLRLLPVPVGDVKASVASRWKQVIEQTTRMTVHRSRHTAASDEETDTQVASAAGVSKLASSSISSASIEPDFKVVATTEQLRAYLDANEGHLFSQGPQVVGIDFLLADNCQGHNNVTKRGEGPCVTAIAITSHHRKEQPLVLLLRGVDKKMVIDAFQGLWSDGKVVKAMYALQRPALGWSTRFGRCLLDASNTSLITKAVDLQLLVEHAVTPRHCDATMEEIAAAIHLEGFVENSSSLRGLETMRTSSGSFKLHDHQISGCHQAVDPQIQHQLVENARLLMAVYFQLRMSPDHVVRVTPPEWKITMTEVTLMTAERCAKATSSITTATTITVEDKLRGHSINPVQAISRNKLLEETPVTSPDSQKLTDATKPRHSLREIKCISTSAQLKTYLASNNGRLVIADGSPQVVGIDFLLCECCVDHTGDKSKPGSSCLAAIIIASDALREKPVVLLVKNIDKKLLGKALQDLLADSNLAKAMYSLRHPAEVCHSHFGMNLLDGSTMKKTVDLQLLFEHSVDKDRPRVSLAELAMAVKADTVVDKLATSQRFDAVRDASGVFMRYEHHLATCSPDEVTPEVQDRLVQNAQLIAIMYMRLRMLPLSFNTEWKQILVEAMHVTMDRCMDAVSIRDVEKTDHESNLSSSAENPVASSYSTNSCDWHPSADQSATDHDRNHSSIAILSQDAQASLASAQRLVRCVSTNAQLTTLLVRNNGRLVGDGLQAVGIDFMLINHCREHNSNGYVQSAPCIAAIAIASDNAAEPALVISPQNIDPDLLVDAFQGLWTDVNVTKAMFALRLPSVAWYSRLKSHLVDESKSASKATTEDLQSLLEQAMDHGEHVIPESSTIKKCVDLQLLLEHVIDSKCRDATVLQLATVAKIDAAANQLALSNFSYKSVTASNAPSHRHASCSREAVKMVDLQRMVQNAQLFATIYTSLRMLPLPLGSDEPSIVNATEWKQKLAEVTRMTADRCVNAVANKGVPSIWFDKRADFQPRSLECLVPNRVHMDTDGEDEDDDTESNTDEDVLPLHRLELQCDIDPLLAVLPHKYRDAVMRIDGFRDRLVDVCLDVGRAPYAYVGKRQRVPLDVQDDWGSGTAVVSKADVEEILALLGGEERIGSDNRAGIDAQLHRVSVMRSKTREVYGVTMRVGRALFHAASALSDLLLSAEHREKSVLLLGHPGSGKTTLIRDVARCVSETQENVCIIDTSNEIGGDGLVPHACVGWARRMMVPSLEMQASVMIECVQNHTVETMVVDEIGRKAEVLAASTVRQRGPRLVASAHGDFRSLLNNPDLKGLVGGTQQVTVGDAAAKASGFKGKLRTERAGNPIFDVIVELDRQSQGVCHIIWDVGSAVDSVLAGEQVSGMETRRWNASTRGVQVLS